MSDDAHATLLRESLHSFGVNTEYLRSEPNSPSASVIALVSPSGERSIAYMPMAPRVLQARVLAAAIAPDPEAMRQRIAHADIVFFNESGFVAGTGEQPTPQAPAALAGSGPQTIVVTLGAAGAVASERGVFARQAAFAQQIADTTGAGDTFNAAFLALWLEGRTLDACLRFACAAAGHAVTAIGARNGMPDRATAERKLSGDPSCP